MRLILPLAIFSCAPGGALGARRGAQPHTSSLLSSEQEDALNASRGGLDYAVDVPGLGRALGTRSSYAGAARFLSLPYALPPVGPLVLRPPVEFPAPWGSDRGTRDWPRACTQFYATASLRKVEWLAPEELAKFLDPGQRDCLYLNVFAPAWSIRARMAAGAASRSAGLPVMIFIHGGSFQSGDSRGYGIYDGSSLAANENLVVVTLNYRLGAEGFLAHPAMLADGGQYNLGLLDQRLGMKWVSQHIGAFGGDPGRVVVFGESAGAMSICFHLTSPRSFQYFHGAILQSPGCEGNSVWMERGRAETFAKVVAFRIGCASGPGDPGNLTCLQARLGSYEVLAFSEWVDIGLRFGQVPDEASALTPVIDLAESGLAKMPNELIEEGRFHRVPIIAGTNHDEGTLFKLLNPVEGSGEELFWDLLYHIVGPKYAAGAYTLYGPVDSPSKLLAAVGDFLGDGLFVCPTYNFVRAVAKHSDDIYFYRFTQGMSTGNLFMQLLYTLKKLLFFVKGRIDALAGLFLGWHGVPHTFDLFFVFDTEYNPDAQMIEFTTLERHLAESFQGYWGQFARNLSPNGIPGMPKWLPFGNASEPEGAVLRMQDPPTMHPVQNDMEAEVVRRCSWWANNPMTLRSRDKTWQLSEKPMDLGLRCCCDLDRVPTKCARVGSRSMPQGLSQMSGLVHAGNWRGHCPVMDLGDGEVQTHHNPLGCMERALQDDRRCCCADRQDVQPHSGRPGVPLCQRFSPAELKRHSRCPRVCVMRDNRCVAQVQTHHREGACDEPGSGNGNSSSTV